VWSAPEEERDGDGVRVEEEVAEDEDEDELLKDGGGGGDGSGWWISTGETMLRRTRARTGCRLGGRTRAHKQGLLPASTVAHKQRPDKCCALSTQIPDHEITRAKFSHLCPSGVYAPIPLKSRSTG
jgi:hypothetical protein